MDTKWRTDEHDFGYRLKICKYNKMNSFKEIEKKNPKEFDIHNKLSS